MKKLKQLFRKFHNKNQGLTLVEMIVTFMLIGLFMIAASKVIANTVSVYYTAKGTANGMQVSSIIASKIRGVFLSLSLGKNSLALRMLQF